MRHIIFNTIKISLAAIISTVIAIMLNLEFAVAVGIVTILTIQPTKKETIKTAVGRFIAFGVALVIANVCFSIMGYNVVAFLVYLVIFILICQIFKWYSAMAMNSVLVSHFLTLGDMSRDSVINEILVFLVGVTVGIIANLHLRKNVNYIEELKDKADNQIKKILRRMSERIVNHDISDYNGECFDKLKYYIRQAKNVAEENYNNQFKGDTFDIEYIKMRDRQCQILYEMYKNVRELDATPITAKRISDFLLHMSDVYYKENTGTELLSEYQVLHGSMKSESLPTERSEFENRAILYILLKRVEEFIKIKAEFADRYYK